MDPLSSPRPVPVHRHFSLAALVFGASWLGVLAGCGRAGDLRTSQEAAVPGEEVPASPAPLALSEAPKAALEELRTASMDGPVAVFKHSQICPISEAAHGRFLTWLGTEGAEGQVKHAHIDVIEQKPLARGLVAELGIEHESPQLLLFHGGEVVWHGSHGAITGAALTDQLLLLD